METIFEPYEPDQVHLLPPAPRDWLPEGHLAHFISDTVDQLDLSPFLARYADRESGKGQKAYHPSMMLKILIYAYCVGIFSSRKIMAALQELVPLRFLAAGHCPGHRTSRIMNTGGKSFEQCYSAQSAVDEANRIIVAADVGISASDAKELLPMVEAAENNTGKKAKRVLADSGYKSEDNLRDLEERGTDGYIALGKGERVPDDVDSSKPATRRMARKLRTKAGRKRYKKRKGIVEPAFGWIKNVLGFRSFSMRGLPKATGEWNLVCLAINLRRMHGMMAWT